MTNNLNLGRRLRELEMLTNGDSLVVRFIDRATKSERQGSVEDLVKNDGDFIGVVSGSALKDVDKILQLMRKQAEVSESEEKTRRK